MTIPRVTRNSDIIERRIFDGPVFESQIKDALAAAIARQDGCYNRVFIGGARYAACASYIESDKS